MAYYPKKIFDAGPFRQPAAGAVNSRSDMNFTTILEAAQQGHLEDRQDIAFLLRTSAPDELRRLFLAAYQVKLQHIGARVSLRGLIELSNYCTKDCYYCGIRKSNAKQHRFRMTEAEIISAAQTAIDFGYGSVVLQGGERCDAENTDFITRIVRRIKELRSENMPALGITLSLGEQTVDTYRTWFAAGAHRYLLRIETSSPELYRRLHPADHSFERRVAALRDLKSAGFQVGTGVMCCLPGQTYEQLADDILFFRRIDADMIGMGPYIPHPDTPLGVTAPELPPAVRLTDGLKMIAVTRLLLRDVNIAASTALQALAPDGREQGLLAGANVIMPNVGELTYRRDYLLYQGKPGTDENAAASRSALENAIDAIGEKIRYGEWGDSPHFSAKK